MSDISVVIPTYNRGRLLMDSVRCCHRMAGDVTLEFIIIDDGSSDDTPARLEELAGEISNLRYLSIENGGPGQARNIGAEMASAELLMFLGDDIQPLSPDFFMAHLDLHRRMPGNEVAVLGKVIWPDRRDAEVNFVMAHIQGSGGEQFGYAHFEPYNWLDWRFFYTANISVKRRIVDDWRRDGFRGDFTAAGYEDVEFAYRMHKSPNGFRLYYAPLSLGSHYHAYDLSGFLSRQIAIGMMARVFIDLHPEVAPMLGVERVEKELKKPFVAAAEAQIPDLLAVIEGIKSWARLLEGQGNLGSQHWHDDMLKSVFALAYLQGYILSDGNPNANLAAAYQEALSEFYRLIQRTIYVEATGGSVASLMRPFSPKLGGLALRHTRLWVWASRQPALARMYRALRRMA